jgi:hypothetical protein
LHAWLDRRQRLVLLGHVLAVLLAVILLLYRCPENIRGLHEPTALGTRRTTICAIGVIEDVTALGILLGSTGWQLATFIRGGKLSPYLLRDSKRRFSSFGCEHGFTLRF